MRSARAVAVLLLLVAVSGCLGDDGGPGARPPITSSPGVTEGKNQTLLASFSVTPTTPLVGQAVKFKDASKDEEFDLVSWAWDFGDGRGSTHRDPVHVYTAGGVYRVVLRVKNEAGLEARASRLVTVPAASATPGPDGDPESPPEYMVFGSPVTVRENDGGEPAIAIDGDGRIFVAPIGRLYRSTDGGKTFTLKPVPGPLNEPLPGDSHVVVDPDDRVWFSNLGGFTFPGSGSASVYTSTDHGDTWRGNPAATDTLQTDRQWIAAPGDGVAYFLYRQCVVSDPVQGVCLQIGSRMTKTTDGGLTWVPLTRAFTWTSFPVADPRDGTVYVFQFEPDGHFISVQVSTDGGATWTEKNIADRKTSGENKFVHGAVDKAGNVYVTWIDKDTNQYDVYVSVSKDRGQTWSVPIRASAGLGTAVFPWIAAGGAGKAVVAWYGTNVTGNPDALAANTQWHVYAAYTSNATAPNVTFASGRATGVVHTGPICMGGAGCSSPTGEPGDRDLLDFLSIALMPDGRAAIAYGEDGSSSVTKARFVLQTDGPVAK